MKTILSRFHWGVINSDTVCRLLGHILLNTIESWREAGLSAVWKHFLFFPQRVEQRWGDQDWRVPLVSKSLLSWQQKCIGHNINLFFHLWTEVERSVGIWKLLQGPVDSHTMLSVRMVMVPATALDSQQIIHLEVLLDYICLHPDEIAFMAENYSINKETLSHGLVSPLVKVFISQMHQC